ncbi:MAG: iron-sulfur cluster repair di-iron protein [Flavobacteriales bacterium]|nr:iron-sulfur cluster repair di-iron protein [Flavobacteriales bacterium]
MTTLEQGKTVADFVRDNYKTSDVFKKHGIDFCCGGKKSLAKVCDQHGLELSQLESELEEVVKNEPQEHDFASWKPGFLIDYIENVHHEYVNRSLPLLIEYANKVARVHGDANPENVLIAELVARINGELTAHMKKEELLLFPNAKRLEKAIEKASEFAAPPFSKFQTSIDAMEFEHDAAGDICKEIRKLSNNYTPPAHACNTYRVLYSKLEEFEDDLHQHVHLENNILFPKILEMEAQIKQA